MTNMTIEEFRHIHEEWQHSGLSIRQYCEDTGIRESRFYYWKAKLKESYDAGFTETIGAFIKAAGLKWNSEPTAEILGQQFRMSWDTNKNLSNELKSKEGIISSKDVVIRGLRAKVTTLTEEVNGLKYRLTLIDENAVERLRNAKNAEIARADKAESELHSLRSTYQNLLGKWNAFGMNQSTTRLQER